MASYPPSKDLVLRETAPDAYQGQAEVAGRRVDVEAKFVKHPIAGGTAFAEATVRLDLPLLADTCGKEELLSAMRAVEATFARASDVLPIVLGCVEEPAGEEADQTPPTLALTLWSCDSPEHEDDEPRALASALRDALDAARTLMPVIEALITHGVSPADVRRACDAVDELGMRATTDGIACLVGALALGVQRAGYAPADSSCS